jgi:hypothetical protein
MELEKIKILLKEIEKASKNELSINEFSIKSETKDEIIFGSRVDSSAFEKMTLVISEDNVSCLELEDGELEDEQELIAESLKEAVEIFKTICENASPETCQKFAEAQVQNFMSMIKMIKISFKILNEEE